MNEYEPQSNEKSVEHIDAAMKRNAEEIERILETNVERDGAREQTRKKYGSTGGKTTLDRALALRLEHLQSEQKRLTEERKKLKP